MPIQNSPGLRTAIGFLKVFGVAGMFWCWGGVLTLAMSCIGVVADAQYVYGQSSREGWLQMGYLFVMVLAVTLGFALRRGAWLLAGVLDEQHAGYSSKTGEMFQSLGWSVGCYGLGLAGTAFGVVAVLAHWFALELGISDALEVLRYASLTAAVISWVLLAGFWKRQKPKRLESTRLLD